MSSCRIRATRRAKGRPRRQRQRSWCAAAGSKPALGRNRTIAHVMHGLSLGLAVGDDQDHAGIHDGLGTHGVGLTGNIVDAVEQAAVG